MATNQLLSETVEPILVFSHLDIGGTNSAAIDTKAAAATNHWVSLANHNRVCFQLFLGPSDGVAASYWTASDDIATITVQQATSSSGAGIKAVSDQTYTITAGDLDALGDVATIEVKSEDLDVANDFRFVRILVAATDNNGVDYVTCVAQLYQPRYSQISKDRIEVQLPQDGYGA